MIGETLREDRLVNSFVCDTPWQTALHTQVPLTENRNVHTTCHNWGMSLCVLLSIYPHKVLTLTQNWIEAIHVMQYCKCCLHHYVPFFPENSVINISPVDRIWHQQKDIPYTLKIMYVMEMSDPWAQRAFCENKLFKMPPFSPAPCLISPSSPKWIFTERLANLESLKWLNDFGNLYVTVKHFFLIHKML